MKACMRMVVLLCFCMMGSVCVHAQKIFSTNSASVKFISTKNSDVAAVNNVVMVTINDQGELSFELLIRDFRFAMVEMEDHFNKNYMDSDKYPNASFKGRLFDFKKINLNRPGVYKVKAEGDMTIHNVTKRIMVNGTLRVENGIIELLSKFTIDIDDYKVDTGLGGMLIGSKMDVDVAAKCYLGAMNAQ